MNTNKILATALVSFIAFGSLTFVPASADSLDSPPAAMDSAAAFQASNETPQHLVWDMTYGDQTPTEPAPATAAVTENTNVTDLSMG